MDPHVDNLAILIAALINWVIGFVWYRWIFPTPRRKLAWDFPIAFVSAWILGFFEVYLGVTTVSDGMFVGALVWIGFVLTTYFSQLLARELSWRHCFIDSGYKLLVFLTMGGIIGA